MAPDLQPKVGVMLARMLARVRRSGDLHRSAYWAERAIAAANGEASPLHADALGNLGEAIAAQAFQHRDQSLARPAIESAEAAVGSWVR